MIRRARRRHISNLVLAQGVNAVSAVMAGVILLLLAGTQILDWPWLVTIVLAAAGLGFARIARRTLSPYRIAQAIDARLGLHDTLSTAWFYAHDGSGRSAEPEIRDAQREAAERAAAGVDLKRAVPFTMPRSLYAMAGLGIVATSLFALRYAVFHSLDLRPALASVVFDVFNPPAQRAALEKKKQQQKRPLNDRLQHAGFSADPEPDTPADPKSAGAPVSSNENAKAEKRDQAANAPKPTGISVENKSQQKNQESSEAGEEGQENAASPGQSDPQQKSERASAERQPSQSQESNSLMDKFRDAMENLLSRLRNNQKSGEGQQMASNQKGQQQHPGQKGGQQKNSQGKGNQKAEGDQNGQSQGEEGDGARQAQNGPGKQSGADSDAQSAKEGKSGIGKEDGLKELKEAEQLAAMGKISEILGKRAQNLTGEMMVEVASSHQQLKTAYSNRNADHADTGSEIHRDEIPLAYQAYVQQYFEQVHKPSPPATAQKAQRAK